MHRFHRCGPRHALPLAFILPACTSYSPPRLEHDHGNSMVTLQIDGERMVPEADVTIPIYSAVCWLRTDHGAGPVEVELDRSPGVCGACATILGFGATEDGRALTLARINKPQGAALICFHETGQFRYTVRGAAQPLSGTIRVVEARGGKS